jgi:uncharacterized membrane protein
LLPQWTDQSFASGVAPDGAFVTGYLDLQTTASDAYVWSASTGLVPLPRPAGTDFGLGYDVSEDGQTVVGAAVSASGSVDLAVRWSGGTPAELPVAPGMAHPFAYAVSADGRVAVGGWAAPTFTTQQAVRWVDGAGGEVLPGSGACAALSVSADASVIVGYTGAGACRWTGGGVEDLTTLVLSMGVDLGGAILNTATAVSPDGRVIAGHIVTQGHDRGWALVLPVAGCYANCDGSAAVPLLNVADFSCFLQRFGLGDGRANCDGSTTPPALNIADFTCFLQRFAAGCP